MWIFVGFLWVKDNERVYILNHFINFIFKDLPKNSYKRVAYFLKYTERNHIDNHIHITNTRRYILGLVNKLYYWQRYNVVQVQVLIEIDLWICK